MNDEKITKKDEKELKSETTPESDLNGEKKPENNNDNSGTQVIKSPLRKNVFAKAKGKRQRPKSEFQQKIINISRVTRVVKGGRRLSFRVDMVIGDKQGRVGLGSGKSLDTSLAIEKAYNKAKKNLIKLKLTDSKSIPHSVEAKFASARIEFMPNVGRGLVAGSTVRSVLEYAGMTNITAKIRSRSSNKLNIAKATLKAISVFTIPMSSEKENNKEDKKE